MKYSTLYDDFKTIFSDDMDTIYKLQEENDVDESDGVHVAFGMVVVPYLELLFSRSDETKLEKLFTFFEEMSSSKDSKICEVIEFTIIEDIISHGNEFLEKCKNHMGPEMLKSCVAIENFMIVD